MLDLQDHSSTLAHGQALRDLLYSLKRTATIHVVFCTLVYHKRIDWLLISTIEPERGADRYHHRLRSAGRLKTGRITTVGPRRGIVGDGRLILLYPLMIFSVFSRRSGLLSRTFNSSYYHCPFSTMTSHDGMSPCCRNVLLRASHGGYHHI